MLNKPSNYCQIILNFCQNGEISPNLAMLMDYKTFLLFLTELYMIENFNLWIGALIE